MKLGDWHETKAIPPEDFHYCDENIICIPSAIKVTLCLHPQLVDAFAEWDKTQSSDEEPYTLTELVEDSMYKWLKSQGIDPYRK